jgi:4'-phosphopantetheinyl transferase
MADIRGDPRDSPLDPAELRWMPVAARPWEDRIALPAGAVQLWRCRAPAAGGVRASFEEVLSPEEEAQARRFHFQRDRDLYVAAHGLLRLMLAAYTGADPLLLRFEVGRWGKPQLAGDGGGTCPLFNIAHSGARVLLGFSAGPQIGVDIERHRQLRDPVGIGERFFSAREAAVLRGLEPDAQGPAFFRLWTRKEAVIKALGLPVGGHSSEAEVLPVSERPGAGDTTVCGSTGSPARVRWIDLPTEPGYAAALAAPETLPFPILQDLGDLG